jgi:hypothetical protein
MSLGLSLNQSSAPRLRRGKQDEQARVTQNHQKEPRVPTHRLASARLLPGRNSPTEGRVSGLGEKPVPAEPCSSWGRGGQYSSTPLVPGVAWRKTVVMIGPVSDAVRCPPVFAEPCRAGAAPPDDENATPRSSAAGTRNRREGGPLTSHHSQSITSTSTKQECIFEAEGKGAVAPLSTAAVASEIHALPDRVRHRRLENRSYSLVLSARRSSARAIRATAEVRAAPDTMVC